MFLIDGPTTLPCFWGFTFSNLVSFFNIWTSLPTTDDFHPPIQLLLVTPTDLPITIHYLHIIHQCFIKNTIYTKTKIIHARTSPANVCQHHMHMIMYTVFLQCSTYNPINDGLKILYLARTRCVKLFQIVGHPLKMPMYKMLQCFYSFILMNKN